MVRTFPSGLILALCLASPSPVSAAGLAQEGGLTVGGPVHVDQELEVSQKLASELLRVPSNRRRSEILDELFERSKSHSPTTAILKKAVQDVWLLGCKRFATRATVRSFKPLLAAREDLDRLRSETLSIIRDEYEYPYPFEAPAATSEEVGRYKRAQRKIDARVEAMRGLWREGPKVRLSATAVEALELAHWARLQCGRLGREGGLNFGLPRPKAPPWALGLPLRGDADGDYVTLPTFGMSLYEGKRLAHNRAIRSLNDELRKDSLEGIELRSERKRIEDEFEQVRRTNEYRELLGLQALHVSLDLLEACRQHANYIWELGELTHEQPSAEFNTHNVRARRVGYPTRVWENCHMGSNLPFDVLEAWRVSSEHHRVMVMEEVREIATARAGLAWVQNYGLDTGFLSGIQWGVWRD